MYGEKKWIDLSDWAPSMKILVSHVNAHQRLTPAEGDFSNKIDRIPCFVNVNEPSSLSTPATYRLSSGKRGYGGRKGGYAWAHPHELSLPWASLARVIAEYPTAF